MGRAQDCSYVQAPLCVECADMLCGISIQPSARPSKTSCVTLKVRTCDSLLSALRSGISQSLAVTIVSNTFLQVLSEGVCKLRNLRVNYRVSYLHVRNIWVFPRALIASNVASSTTTTTWKLAETPFHCLIAFTTHSCRYFLI